MHCCVFWSTAVTGATKTTPPTSSYPSGVSGTLSYHIIRLSDAWLVEIYVPWSDVVDEDRVQLGQLSQANRAATCISFGKK